MTKKLIADIKQKEKTQKKNIIYDHQWLFNYGRKYIFIAIKIKKNHTINQIKYRKLVK